MVIEHSFVSCLPPTDVMTRASEFLATRGFSPVAGTAFPVGQEEWTALEMRRGKKNPARAKNVTQLPQSLRMEYDRGRVTVAMSIGINAAWGGRSISFTPSQTTLLLEHPKKTRLHALLLHSVTHSLQTMLAYDQSGVADAALLDEAEAAILAAARSRRNRQLLIIGIILAVIIGMITLGVLSARH